ncbi:MAG: S8 family serine peptidase [Planctomycetes bacterium]|nr:S8 family serine peptidase [Planctomycetota bacterium]
MPASRATTHATLDPSLRAALDHSQPGERLDVYAVFADALPASELERLADGRSPRARRPVVVSALRAHADVTQREARALLAAAAAAGHADAPIVLWIGNALRVRAEAPVIEALAALPGVDRVRRVVPLAAERTQDAPPSPPLVPGVGNVPFSDDFESGQLLPHWTVETTGNGYAAVTNTDGPLGAYHLEMASSVDGVDSTASVTVQLDLAGLSDIGIRFKQKEFGDEDHPEDGVFVSPDGVNYTLVESLNGGPSTYATRVIDLDAVTSGLGIAYTSTFHVRFQWRDNFDIPTDGMAFDEIEIGPGVAQPTVEPNLVAQQAPQLWEKGFRGEDILLGLIDSGTWWMHPDLVNRTWTNPGEIAGNGLDDDGDGYVDDVHGWDFEHGDNDPSSLDAHGTNTAGLAVGDGSSGQVTGMAPGATMVVTEIGSEAAYWEAQQYLVALGVDVITSSHSFKWIDVPDYAMHRAVCDVELAAGIIHSNSIGNQGGQLLTHPIPFNIAVPGSVPSPFAHPDEVDGGRSSVLACGGVMLAGDALYGPTGRGPAAWENVLLYDPTYPHAQDPDQWDYPYGGFGGGLPGLVKPDLVAYTGGVTTTALPSGYISFTGTSASTPQLGGALCLLRQVQPEALPRHLAAALELSAVDLGAPGKDDIYGAGRLAVYAAARRLLVLCRASPDVAPIGSQFDLELFGKPNQTLYGFLGLSILDDGSAFHLAQPYIPISPLPLDASGHLVVTIPTPSDPGLAGLSVWFQFGAPIKNLDWGLGPLLSVPERVTFSL